MHPGIATFFLVIILAAPVLTILWLLYRQNIRAALRSGGQRSLSRLGSQINVQRWATRHGLRFWAAGNQLRQAARMEASPAKHFFRADRVMELEDDGPYAEGDVQGRRVYLYTFVGQPRMWSAKGKTRVRSSETVPNFFGLDFGMPKEQRVRVLYGWALEVVTHSIPHRASVVRHDLHEGDQLNTESRTFESRYDITDVSDSLVLQLIDPAMMQHIEASRADAIEFSDTSIVLYELSEHVTCDVLDAMLEGGLQIARQVDRNYPLGKYARHSVDIPSHT
jgi:hypothetical protein